MKRFALGCVAMVVFSFAHSAELKAEPDKAAESGKVVKPISAEAQRRQVLASCVDAIQQDGNTFTLRMAKGGMMEITRSEVGKPERARFVAADGTETVHELARAESPNSASPEIKAEVKSEDYIKLRKKVVVSMLKFLAVACKVGLEKPAAKSIGVGDGGVATTNDYGDGEWDYLRDLYSDYLGWQEADYHEATNWIIQDDFYNREVSFLYEWRDRIAPTCRDVVTDCQSTCDRVASVGGGITCTALGAAAGVFLSPGIGIAVGAYCGGKFWEKAEECRVMCNVPVVRCN